VQSFWHPQGRAGDRHRPTLVVLDDLQWADDSSLQLLEFVTQPVTQRLIYQMFSTLLGWIVLRARSDTSKGIEILVL
jgi:predicted ATPase